MRFESLDRTPMETRRLLRRRLISFLQSPESPSVRTKVILSDQETLSILRGIEIHTHNRLDHARRFYEAQRIDGVSKSFDDLLDEGWIYCVGDRVYPAGYRNTATALRSLPDPDQRAIKALAAHFSRWDFDFLKTPVLPQGGASIATELRTGQFADSFIGCRSPVWVAARLWEPTSDLGVPDIAWWLERWQMLGRPGFVPSQVWESADAERFINEALVLLAMSDGFVTWEELEQRASKSIYGSRGIAHRITTPATIDSIVDAAGRIGDNVLEPFLLESLFGGLSELSSLAHVLFKEVCSSTNPNAAHILAINLFDLAISRPELLKTLTLGVKSEPRLLADLLLFPKTSALACAMIANWHPPHSAYDRDVWERDSYENQLKSFRDGLEVLRHFVMKGDVAPAEFASLAVEVYEHARARGTMISRRTYNAALLTAFNEFVGNTPASVLTAVIDSLSSAQQFHLGSSSFTAALEIISRAELEETIDPRPIVDTYIRTIREIGHRRIWTSADQMSAASAASLVRLATRTTGDSKDFWSPLNREQHYRALLQETANKYSAALEVARSWRFQIRILSRAIAGWGGDPPTILKKALTDAVKRGIKPVRRGHLNSFAPSFEVGPTTPPPDRFIADDIADALRVLSSQDRKKLLSAILVTNEPFILAKLLTSEIPGCRPQIRARLEALPPYQGRRHYVSDRCDCACSRASGRP